MVLTLPAELICHWSFIFLEENYIVKIQREAQYRLLNLVLVLRLSMVQYVCFMV